MHDLLSTIKIGKSERPMLERDISNWLKLSEIIYSTLDEHKLLKLLKVELESKNRAYNVKQLYARFCTARAIRERKVLQEWNRL